MLRNVLDWAASPPLINLLFSFCKGCDTVWSIQLVGLFGPMLLLREFILARVDSNSIYIHRNMTIHHP